MKRTLSFLLACLLVLGLFPVHVHAEEMEAVETTTHIPSSTEYVTQSEEEDSLELLAFGDYVYWEEENNSAPIWANPIKDDYTVKGNVSRKDSIDTFTFVVSSRSIVTITATASYSTLILYLLDFSPDIIGKTHGTYNSSTQNYQYVLTQSLDVGVYYISMFDNESSGNSYAFHLDIQPCKHFNYSSSTVSPNCVSEGYTERTCSDCGYQWKVDITAALGHKYGDWEVTQGLTCTQDEIRTRCCSTCGTTETKTIPTTGHSYGSWKTESDATCTEAGVKVRTCSVCGNKETAAIPAKGHTYGDWVVTKQPTEDEEGLKVKTCTFCGDKIEEVLPKQEHVHNHTAVVTNPTCVDQGYTTHTCTCGDSYVDSYIPANGVHSYTDDTDASCNVCGYVREIGGDSAPGIDTGDAGTKENPVPVALGQTYHKEWFPNYRDDSHYTRFTIPERGIVTFHVTKPVASNQYEAYEFTLSDLSGNTIYADDCYETREDDRTYYEFHCGLDAGTYSLKIAKEFYAESCSMDYRITSAPTQYCEVEINDEQEAATVLALNQQYTGFYGCHSYNFNETDWYKFELKKDRTYRLSVEGLKSRTPLVVLSGDNMNISYITNKENHVFKAPEDGTYYLKIYNDHGCQEAYQISVQTLDHFAQEAAFDTDYRKEWNNYSNDKHYVKFTVPEQGIATFHVTKPVVEDQFHSYTFTIWDASENTIFSMGTKDSVTDKNTYYEFHCGLEAGNYYLMIVPNYTLLFQTFSSDYRISFTPDAHCEIEPNGDKETATELALGVPRTGHYGSDGSYSHANSDYYKFDAIAGHTYKITIENFEQFQDAYAYFYLHGETKTSLKNTMKNQVDENGLHYYTFTADKDETLYIEFEDYRGVQLPYKIMVAEEAGDKENPVLVTLGETYHKEWPYRGGDHYARFTIPERGIVTFHMTKPMVENQYEEYEFTLSDLSENTIYANDCYKAVDDDKTYYEFHCGLEAGTYLWKISYGDESSSSDYRITFSPTQYCEVEPNDGKETATVLTLGKPYTGHFGGGSYDLYKADYYQFQAEKGKTYKIALDSLKKLDGLVSLITDDAEKDITFLMKADENGLDYYTVKAKENCTYYIKIWNVFSYQRTYQISVTEDHTHSYTSVVTEPTCTEEGYTTHTCSCGDSYVDSKVSKLGHDYVNYVCTRCGDVKYNITRISGKDRHETAFKIANMMKEVLGIEKFDTILIASGDDSADALAGSYLAATKQAPILLSRNKSHPQNLAYIQENLSANGIVYILGGTGAVPQEMEDLLIANNIRYERIKGKDRFGTNIEILKKAGGIQGSEILVSTGYNFADSLSASATGKPILLVNSKRNILTDAQKAYLSEITAGGGKTFTIIGGTGAVSNELAEALEAYGTVNREKGATRELTSVTVATTYFQDPDTVFLAYSRNFPDGLCGGPLAYAMKAPLLLVNKNQEVPAALYVAANDITTGYILGGTAAVNEESVNRIFPK